MSCQSFLMARKCKNHVFGQLFLATNGQEILVERAKHFLGGFFAQ
jgi:hypothetical protein